MAVQCRQRRAPDVAAGHIGKRRDLIVGGFDDATTDRVLCVRVGAGGGGGGGGDMVSAAIMFQCYFGSGFDVVVDEKTYS